MRGHAPLTLGALALALFSPACAGGQGERPPSAAAAGCPQNLQVACYCADGAVGAQRCGADGSFGACDCSGGAPPPVIGEPIDMGGLQGAGGAPDVGPVVADTEGIRPAESLAPGEHRLQLSHGGHMRSYDLYVPDGHDNSHNVPLVVHFHGLTVTMAQNELMTGYGELGRRRGFAVAMPAGIGDSWNGGSACCAPASGSVDDVGFARALVEEISRRVWIHPGRVYAAGFSNGSFLAQRLACEAADVFSAVAGAAGGVSQQDWGLGCRPSRAPSVLLYFGTKDETYPLLADASYRFWKTQLGCGEASDVSYQQGAATCVSHRDCRDGAELVRCTVTDLAHCWPGAGHACLFEQTTAIDATTHSWEFFGG